MYTNTMTSMSSVWSVNNIKDFRIKVAKRRRVVVVMKLRTLPPRAADDQTIINKTEPAKASPMNYADRLTTQRDKSIIYMLLCTNRYMFILVFYG